MSALGALDTAFWDLRGKAEDQPLWKLLGGRQAACPAYGSALLWNTPEALADETARLIDRGFRRVKMRLGRNREDDIAAVQAVRGVLGNTGDLMVDGSMRYDLETAREFAAFLAEQQRLLV